MQWSQKFPVSGRHPSGPSMNSGFESPPSLFAAPSFLEAKLSYLSIHTPWSEKS